MLSLGRKNEQALLFFGPDGRQVARVLVYGLRHDPKVRLAIDAPAEIRVLREELHDALVRQTPAAEAS